MLCCAVLRCAVLCYAMLCYAMLSQGGWEGRPRTEVHSAEVLARMNGARTRYDFKPDGVGRDGAAGESARQVEERMVRYLEEHVLPLPTAAGGEGPSSPPRGYATNLGRQHTAVIFTHGVAIKFLLRRLAMGSPAAAWKQHVDNASITEVLYSPDEGARGGWSVVRVNDASHMEGVERFELKSPHNAAVHVRPHRSGSAGELRGPRVVKSASGELVGGGIGTHGSSGDFLGGS